MAWVTTPLGIDKETLVHASVLTHTYIHTNQSLIQMAWDLALDNASEEEIGGRFYDALMLLAPNLRSVLTKPRQM
jgi:hypothetical protein